MLSSWRDLRSSKRIAFILFTSSQIYSSSGNRVKEVNRAGPLWWLLAITVENEVHRQHYKLHWQRGVIKNKIKSFELQIQTTCFFSKTSPWFPQKSVRFTFGIKKCLLHLNSISGLGFGRCGNVDADGQLVNFVVVVNISASENGHVWSFLL